jgi:hypothetical protein
MSAMRHARPVRRADRWRVVVAGPLLVAAVGAASGCDTSSGERGAGTDTVAWCEQFGVAMSASAALDALDRDDPGVDTALAAVQHEMGALSELTPPAAIADDWETVSAPPPTNEAGAVELGGPLADAGDRIATWALQECDLSGDVRAALDRPADD